MKLGIISPRALIRRALSAFLTSTGAGLVVMEGRTLSECLDEVKRSQAGMLIVDLAGDGLESLPDLSILGPAPKVVVLMDELDCVSSARAFELGIWGCLSTRQSPMVYQNALNCVARGERWMSQQSVLKGTLETRGQSAAIPEELTPREWEVLGLMANGFHNKEISTRLHITEGTAKTHIKSIYRKLNIKGRRDAISRYFEFIRSLETAPGRNFEEGPFR